MSSSFCEYGHGQKFLSRMVKNGHFCQNPVFFKVLTYNFNFAFLRGGFRGKIQNQGFLAQNLSKLVIFQKKMVLKFLCNNFKFLSLVLAQNILKSASKFFKGISLSVLIRKFKVGVFHYLIGLLARTIW